MNTSHQKTYDFLKAHPCGVLSTASKDGLPWGAVVYYVADERLNFYFLTHTSSKKYKNLQEQPHAALTVADNDQQTTVQAAGKIATLEIGDEMNDAYRKIVEIHPPGEYSWVPPVSKLHNGETMVLKLTPTHVRFSKFIPSQSEPHIEEVI